MGKFVLHRCILRCYSRFNFNLVLDLLLLDIVLLNLLNKKKKLVGLLLALMLVVLDLLMLLLAMGQDLTLTYESNNLDL